MVLDVAEWARFEIHSGGKPAGYLNHRLARGEIALTQHETAHAPPAAQAGTDGEGRRTGCGTVGAGS
jgi:hypothetical protein